MSYEELPLNEEYILGTTQRITLGRNDGRLLGLRRPDFLRRHRTYNALDVAAALIYRERQLEDEVDAQAELSITEEMPMGCQLPHPYILSDTLGRTAVATPTPRKTEIIASPSPDRAKFYELKCQLVKLVPWFQTVLDHLVADAICSDIAHGWPEQIEGIDDL